MKNKRSALSHQRWIMHMDMDAFFASIEQLDDPSLRGKPLIVGGEHRGVVSTCSYEARKFGVHSAMPIAEARRRCPHGIYLRPRMRRYAEVSGIVRETLSRFSPLVEMASVDEAYLDATGLERLFGPVEELGRQLKAAVREATGGLTCSVGIAPVKFLAKISSEQRKPDGLFLLRPEDVPDFLESLPVRAVPGVGKHFAADLAQLGVKTCGEVARYSEDFWRRRFGKAGTALWQRAQGIDPREVVPWTPPKSESAEVTLDEDTSDRDILRIQELHRDSLRQNHFAESFAPVVEYLAFSVEHDGTACDGARLALLTFSRFSNGQLAVNGSDFSFFCIHIST